MNEIEHNKLPSAFEPAAMWQVRQATGRSIGRPCDLCGANFIQIPFEVVTFSGKIVCPICCHRWNPLIAELLDSFKSTMQEGYGEFLNSGTSIMYQFGFGLKNSETEPTNFKEMLAKIARCLELNDCSAFIFINNGVTNFRGKPIVRSESASDAAKAAMPGISDILKEYTGLGSFLHYFFLWNKMKLGGVSSPVMMDNFNKILN